MQERTTRPAYARVALTRRRVLALTGVGAIAVALPARAEAPDDQLVQTIKGITEGAAVKEGRVKLVLPELAENGNSVQLVVTVDTPQTAADHAKMIHIISEKNPIANVVKFHLGPRSGRARIATNIRLATSQKVVALAEMSDGSFWSGSAEVVVTLAACIDPG